MDSSQLPTSHFPLFEQSENPPTSLLDVCCALAHAILVARLQPEAATHDHAATFQLALTEAARHHDEGANRFHELATRLQWSPVLQQAVALLLAISVDHGLRRSLAHSCGGHDASMTLDYLAELIAESLSRGGQLVNCRLARIMACCPIAAAPWTGPVASQQIQPTVRCRCPLS